MTTDTLNYASLNKPQREIVDASRVLLVEYLSEAWNCIEKKDFYQAGTYIEDFNYLLNSIADMAYFFPEATAKRLKAFASKLENKMEAE